LAPANNGAPGATLNAQNYDLSASVINVGGGNTGLVLDSGLIAGFAGANSVTLRSGSVFNLFDANGLSVGDSAHPIGTLTFNGAGLFSQGGTTTINATNVVLTGSQSTPNTNGALSGPATGTLAVNTGGTFTQGAGAVVLGNFSQVNVASNQAIAFSGTGSLNAGAANISLTAPALLVYGGATQSLTTAGAVTIAGAGTAPQPTGLGGALTVTAGSITMRSGTILAPSGNVTLTANSGNAELDSGALISVTGAVVTVLDQTEYALGGAVVLNAVAGDVKINQGATIDVSAGGGLGYAGSLMITAAGTTTLAGALKGGAAFNDAGGNFALTTGQLVGDLPLSSGFTGSFQVALQNGDITIPQSATLTSKVVSLTANNGSVTVDGTIDASGPSGGSIALYGAIGVKVDATALLNASYQGITDPRDPGYANGASTMVQNGGTITLGTTGTPTGSVDPTLGFETVASSGAITVAAGAILNVSGGPGTTNVSSNGGPISSAAGTIILRAPILTTGNVNVSFKGTVVASGSSGPNSGVVLDAYAVWSTTDKTSGLQHFDGIIDPAGWFDSSGKLIAGGSLTAGDIHTLPSNLVNQSHLGFYQTTLVSFVQTLFNSSNVTAVEQDFSGLNTGSTLHLRPEIDLVNPSAAINGGNITVASNWNLGGVQKTPSGSLNSPLNPAKYQPAYRTTVAGDAGESGALTLRAANNIQINATISDGFYETYEAFNRSATTSYQLVADLIANNPAVAARVSGTGAATVTDLNTTSAANLMPIVPGVNDGSFSFNFVAGAANIGGAAPSVNPGAVIALSPSSVTATNPTDSITINGHTSYANTFGSASIGRMIDIPTLVRTGTGSINIAAAGNVEFLDATAPGAVYTAGAATATPAGFAQPTIPAGYFTAPNGLVSIPTWAAGGGTMTVAAGGSIIDIETPTDPGTTNATEQFGVPNGPTGQFWSPWYVHYGHSNGTSVPFGNCTVACQTATWINYAAFSQGFGALGGGNITLKAGADIDDVGASLPETLAVSGGGTTAQTAGPVQATWFGGGNLVVRVGGNINSSDFLVGRGAGLIQAGGAVQVDNANPITGQPTVALQVSGGAGGTVSGSVPLPMLLAVQDGFVTVSARGPVTLGNVYDPASLPLAAGVQTSVRVLPGAIGASDNFWSNFFTSYGPESGVSLTSTAGDVTALTVSSSDGSTFEGLFVHGNTSPSIGAVSATTIGMLLPATLDLSALSGSVSVNAGNVGNANLIPYPTQTGSDTGTISIVAAQSINLGSGLAMPDLKTTTTQFFSGSSVDLANYISPLGTPEPNLKVALHANDTVPAVIAAGQDIMTVGALGTTPMLSLIKPASIEAGRNIMFGTAGVAGDSVFIGENNNVLDITSIRAGNDIVGGSYVLYGPGTFVIEAGHDMGPFQPSLNIPGEAAQTWGIATLGNGSAVGNTFLTSFSLPFRPYLPSQSAELDLLFGVGPGINYTAAINQYVDPASAGAGGIDFLADIATILGQSRGQAWATFRQISPAQQHLLVDRAFLDFLTQVTKDDKDPNSPFFGQFGRAYQAISTLFPASLGYTDDASGGGANGAATAVLTGKLNLAASVIETQMGGDINIIGPGGGITVGHSSRDTLNPSQEGILTLAGGNIRAYTDGTILLNQSRIMTQQGGDISIFSANGNISAGEGPKTFASDPPITDICDFNGFCHVNPSGLVTGAGIAAVTALPGETQGNVTLAAPHGTIDVGAAGLRGTNITVAALQVLNSFNIQATGAVTGLTFTPPPNVTGALSAQNTTGALQTGTAAPASQSGSGPASVIIVQVIGYGGGDTPDSGNDDEQRRRQQQP
jgi:hypothetical protein